MRNFYGRKISRRIDDSKIIELKNFEFFLDKSKIQSKIRLIKKKFNEFNLEIGFGMGCNLINEAASSRGTCFLGCDPFLNGSIKLFKAINETGLDNIFFSNLDFYTFAEYFKKIKFKNFFILFPDPWPKNKHKKRRLINKKFVKKLITMSDNESSIFILTDDKEYLSQINFVFGNGNSFKLLDNNNQFFLSQKYPTHFTKYYKRASSRNMKINSLIFKYKN